MDGWVTIGTKLDSKQLEADLKNAERRLQQYEKEAERLTTVKSKVEVDLQAYEQQKKSIEESTNEMLKFAETEEQVENVLAMENIEIEQLNEKYSEQFKKIEEINQKIQENAHNQGLVKNQIQEINKQLQKSNNLSDIKKGIDNIGNSVEKVTKKVGRWALAVFGIRSAYLFVRQAMSTLSQYNDDLANKLSSIRLVLATALEPIINRIISLVITLLNYLNYITKAWFGLDLFARASELSTKKMAENVGAGASAAEEMKKQLAGFDEMNVVQDNQSAGGGGAGGGAKTPEFNLPEGKVPEWLEWVKDHGQELLSIFAGIIGFLTALKLGLDPIKALGIGIMIAGIVYAIQGLIEYLKDPNWESFSKIIQGIGIALIGLGIIIGNVPLILIGVLVLIIGLVIKYWDKIKAFFEENILGWFEKKREAVKKKFGDFGLAIFNTAENFLKMIMNIVQGQIQALRKVFDGIITFIKGVFTGNWKKALEGLKMIFQGVFDGLKTIVVNVWNFIKATVSNMAIATANAFKGVITGAINGLFGMIESMINGFISNLNLVIKLINKIPGVNLKTINKLHITRLATGGIINQPGRGVPVGGAIGGEAGREGVLPLTDRSAMEMLGREIGKWITLNANIPISIGNRQIAREVRQLMAQDDFAMNN